MPRLWRKSWVSFLFINHAWGRSDKTKVSEAPRGTRSNTTTPICISHLRQPRTASLSVLCGADTVSIIVTMRIHLRSSVHYRWAICLLIQRNLHTSEAEYIFLGRYLRKKLLIEGGAVGEAQKSLTGFDLLGPTLHETDSRPCLNRRRCVRAF